jgi:hypothetical protein
MAHNYSFSEGRLAVATGDHNLYIYEYDQETQSLTPVRQISGFNDEILDASFADNGKQLLIATNSELV